MRTADTALNEKHQFDTRFEDLFRDRSEAEILAIKKKYGATGDILEAERRIAAIARNLVDHYIDNILPDGFKAQVVCHSKIAAVRYRNAIREALADRLARERAAPSPDSERIRRIAFLKTAAVVSADPTNEAAEITQARTEARRWNAVENFCKPFDLDDPDQERTGIALLVVCDMLLTGFDAVPIEERDIHGKTVFIVGGGALVVCLDREITLETVQGISTLKDELNPGVMRVVFRDSGFQDDVVKTNTVQILKRAGIEDVKSL